MTKIELWESIKNSRGITSDEIALTQDIFSEVWDTLQKEIDNRDRLIARYMSGDLSRSSFFTRYENITDLEGLDKSQLIEANDIVGHMVFCSKDTSNIAWEYLEKNGLLEVQKEKWWPANLKFK